MTEEQEFQRVWRIHNTTDEILEPLGLKVLERQNNNDRVDDILKKLVNRIREQTIQECLGCVPLPEEEIIYVECPHSFDCGGCMDKENKEGKAFNECREQTIKNINNLNK